MKNQIQEYTQTEAALADLRIRYSHMLWDVSSTDGMNAAKKARAEVRGYRTGLEDMRKEIKAPALERCRLIDDEAKRITAELVAIEKPIDAAIKAEEDRKAAEKAEKERIERERIQAIRGKIGAIVMLPARHIGSCASELEGVIASLLDPTFEQFAEFTGEAILAHDDALRQLETMLTARKEREAEDARIDAERAELARLRAAQEAGAAEQRRIGAEKLAAERAELAKLRAAQEEQAAEVKREQARLAAIQRAEIERQQAEINAERAAMEAERIKAEAEAKEVVGVYLKLDPAACRVVGRPSDSQIILSICTSFGVGKPEVISWIRGMDLDAAQREAELEVEF